jgi:hypothetical protein
MLAPTDASNPPQPDFQPTSYVAMSPRQGEKQMKLRHIAPLAIAASAAAIGLAPIASADANVQQSPGNAQVTATPGEAAQQAAQNQMPFGGDSGALLFHHHGIASAH